MTRTKQTQLLKLLAKSSQPNALKAFLSKEGNSISVEEGKFLCISDPARVMTTLRQRGFKVESYRSAIKGQKGKFETRYRYTAPAAVTAPVMQAKKFVGKRKNLALVVTLD